MSNDTSTPQVHRLMPWSNIDRGYEWIDRNVDCEHCTAVKEVLV